MVRSRAAVRYITQSGRVDGTGIIWGGGGGTGAGDSVADGVGSGVVGSNAISGVGGGVGGSSVVKAPTALQSLWLLALLALTFQ